MDRHCRLKSYHSIDAEELLRKGAEKILKFNSDLSLYGPNSFTLTLLYPERTEVKYVQGGTEPFTLQRYKEELGKSFNRITLYLYKTTAIFDAMFLKSTAVMKVTSISSCLITEVY